MLETSNARYQQALADWQSPIDFYGKVVDENGNPVGGAHIRFGWTEVPLGADEQSFAESDSEGLFALRGKRGPTLEVEVRKEGYYTSRSTPRSFHYSLANRIFHPDPADPVLFRLRKKRQGTDLITSDNGIRLNVAVRVPKDGTPVRVDLLQKKVSTAGELEIAQTKPPWRGAREWSLRMRLLSGGFLENADEFQFEAPAAGYQSAVDYRFTKSETNWITHVTKQFYIEFGQPRKYGWLRIESDLAQETVFLTYAINPDGSRNLEPAN